MMKCIFFYMIYVILPIIFFISCQDEMQESTLMNIDKITGIHPFYFIEGSHNVVIREFDYDLFDGVTRDTMYKDILTVTLVDDSIIYIESEIFEGELYKESVSKDYITYRRGSNSNGVELVYNSYFDSTEFSIRQGALGTYTMWTCRIEI